MTAFNAGRGDRFTITLGELFHRFSITRTEELFMPDMPKDNIPDNVLKKVAGTSKCAEDPPQDDCCEEEDDD